MGFFSKIWKGVKKTFKKIGRGIKKVFKKVGKFMGKIGIVGQIAMMFLPIPGLSSIFGALGKVGSKALGWLNKFGAIGQGAAKVLGSAYKFVRAVAKPFVDIGKGITGFITDTTKFVLNKIPGVNIASAPTSIFGEGGAWATAQERVTGAFKGFTGDIADAFSGNIDDLLPKQTNVPGTGVLKQEELAKQPSLDPASEYQKAMQAELDYISDPISNQRSAFTPLETLDPDVYDASKAIAMQGKGPLRLDADISSGIVDSTVSSETARAGQSLLSRGLEAVTGEETLGGVGRKAASRFGEYLLDAPGKAVASTITTGIGQAAGVIAKPPGDPGPAWSSYPSQFTSSVYGATTQAMQPLEDLDIFQQRQMGFLQGDYGYSGMAEGMGYGGPDFNSGYSARLAKFAPSY